jgi:hypothetical protein
MNVIRSPWVAVPAVVGAGATGLAALVGGLGYPNGMLSFVGISGLLFGAGMAATRLLFYPESVVASVCEDSVKDELSEHEAYLRELEERLRADQDDRTGRCLQRLRNLQRRVHKRGLLDGRVNSPMLPEIRPKVEQLYRSCVRSLEKSLEFWQAAMEMATQEARQEMLDRREQLLAEIEGGIRHLAATVDHLRAKQISRHDGERELAQVRRELEMGLEVARRVEQRIDELEGGIVGGTLEQAQDEGPTNCDLPA